MEKANKNTKYSQAKDRLDFIANLRDRAY